MKKSISLVLAVVLAFTLFTGMVPAAVTAASPIKIVFLQTSNPITAAANGNSIGKYLAGQSGVYDTSKSYQMSVIADGSQKDAFLADAAASDVIVFDTGLGTFDPTSANFGPVIEAAASAGIKYINGPNTVTYFGGLFY